MTGQLLAPLRPDESALTPLFQANVDEAMLRKIAAADYGSKADECYALLQQILKTGLVASNDYNLREVLELTRWTEPDIRDWRPGADGLRGHWMRLFACTSLVRLAPKYKASFDSECDTLAQLISSAIDLGRPVARAAASLLAWRFLAYSGSAEDPPFVAFSILLLAVHLERGEHRGLWLRQLAESVEAEEGRIRNEISEAEWLMRETSFPQRGTLWPWLADRILTTPDSPHPHEAEEALRRLGKLLAGS